MTWIRWFFSAKRRMISLKRRVIPLVKQGKLSAKIKMRIFPVETEKSFGSVEFRLFSVDGRKAATSAANDDKFIFHQPFDEFSQFVLVEDSFKDENIFFSRQSLYKSRKIAMIDPQTRRKTWHMILFPTFSRCALSQLSSSLFFSFLFLFFVRRSTFSLFSESFRDLHHGIMRIFFVRFSS